jgi:hypothetical protein
VSVWKTSYVRLFLLSSGEKKKKKKIEDKGKALLNLFLWVEG